MSLRPSLLRGIHVSGRYMLSFDIWMMFRFLSSAGLVLCCVARFDFLDDTSAIHCDNYLYTSPALGPLLMFFMLCVT